MMVTGGLIHRLGPRVCAVLGGVLFGGGWLLASLGRYHFLFTLLGIGLVAGVGVGFAYIVPIATCIRWFPDHKGLVTGVAVAGFGGGAALVSQIGGWLMSRSGLSPFDTFAVFGCVFAALVVAGGLTMENPPDTGIRPPAGSNRSVLVDRRFWVLYVAMFTGLAAGFAVNANLKELFDGASLESGIMAVSVFAIANAAGRIIWGWLFDRMCSTTAIRANLLFQGTVLAGSPLVLTSTMGFQTFALLTGFNFGGVLVIYASTTARNWGADRVGQLYGWLFSSNIPAAISPMLAGFAFDTLGSFTLPLGVIGAMLILTGLFTTNRSSILETQPSSFGTVRPRKHPPF
jgi:OFA family oxalate/formate antiporter-like MFS transporter